jgi:hypothetical protein
MGDAGLKPGSSTGKRQQRRVSSLEKSKVKAAFSVETFWRGCGAVVAGILHFAQNDEPKKQNQRQTQVPPLRSASRYFGRDDSVFLL